MKVLPPEIALPAESIVRRHTPKRGAYPTYRSCLEWEFGFFCAFCFIHETDMNEHGFAGLGVMSIEHKATRSAMPDLEDDYRNCFYACRFCNRARSDRPMVSRDRRRLLDPCEVVWAHEFETANDELLPLTADAEYTHEAYDLNDPRKVGLRRNRRTVLTDAQRVIREAPVTLDWLLEAAATETAPDRRMTLLAAARDLRELVRLALKEMRRFPAIPAQAVIACRCRTSDACELPAFVTTQLVNVVTATLVN